MTNLIGPDERLFAERHPGPDATDFQADNTSKEYFESPYYKAHEKQAQGVPNPRTAPPRMNLAEVVGNDMIETITEAGKITFHAVGDTGAVGEPGAPWRPLLAREEAVADMMTKDVQEGGADAPAFFFHLGDVVYYFGEAQYYYDQFYEPFHAYDRPIFAVPGNHDGVVFGRSLDSPQVPSLEAFMRNFCAAEPTLSPDAGTLVRSVMTQPGVYFALDAPLVTVIGLYSNVLEHPGVISSQDKHYPQVGDEQLNFLKGELTRLKQPREQGEQAVIIAVHHPPFSTDMKHAGSPGLSDDIDAACREAGLWPDAVLSGHAHLYQRFTRRVDGREIPYIVSGSGGHAATPPKSALPPAPFSIEDDPDVTLEIDPVIDFGYLTLTTDAKNLAITFRSPNPNVHPDSVTIDLATNHINNIR